jgi:hypothetical protein
MTEFEMVEAISVDAYRVAAAVMTEAGEGWFGADMAARGARLAVAAWATAVNGDDSRLASMADPDAANWLLHPVRKAWAIAPGPVVTEITIWTVKPAAEPPELGVTWRFTGRQRPVEPRPPEPGLARPSGWTDVEQVFVGNLTLAFTGPAAWPWRLTHGHVSTLDDYLGYTFVSRFETAEECRRRLGTSAGGGVLVPTETYLLVAGFAEHDYKFGSSARPRPATQSADRLAQRGSRWGTRSVSAASGWGGVCTRAATPAATRQAAAPVSSAALVPPAEVIAPVTMEPIGVVPM